MSTTPDKDREAPEGPEVEAFLRQMDWCAPSAELDRRVQSLATTPSPSSFRRWWVAGLAASIAAIVSFYWTHEVHAPRNSALVHTDPVKPERPDQPKAKENWVAPHPHIVPRSSSPEIEPVRAAPAIVSNAVDKTYPVKIERVFNTCSADQVEDAQQNPYTRLRGQQIRQVIWVDPVNNRQQQSIVPMAQVEILRFDMY